MEGNCIACGKQADATCACDCTLNFCFEHIIKHLKTPEGQHKLIKLRKIREKFYKACSSSLKKINQTKADLICR